MDENIFSLTYVPSKRRTFNCPRTALESFLKHNPYVQLLNRQTLPPDNFEVAFPAKIFITNTSTNEQTRDLHDYVLKRYKTERVSKRQAERLLDELNQGLISWFDLLGY